MGVSCQPYTAAHGPHSPSGQGTEQKKIHWKSNPNYSVIPARSLVTIRTEQFRPRLSLKELRKIHTWSHGESFRRVENFHLYSINSVIRPCAIPTRPVIRHQAPDRRPRPCTGFYRQHTLTCVHASFTIWFI
jgi:hypothetical protein